MKLHICDPCLTKGDIAPAKWKRSLKSPTLGKIQIECCDKCNKSLTELTREDMRDILLKSIKMSNKILS